MARPISLPSSTVSGLPVVCNSIKALPTVAFSASTLMTFPAITKLPVTVKSTAVRADCTPNDVMLG
jgi:hypothetical protein